MVPGDIVILEEGDAVPADVRIVEAASFEVVESILTGESVPVMKNTNKVWTKVRMVTRIKNFFFKKNYNSDVFHLTRQDTFHWLIVKEMHSCLQWLLRGEPKAL